MSSCLHPGGSRPLPCGLRRRRRVQVAAGPLGLDGIRELTGLSAPTETGMAQQARQRDIVSRADSLVVSTVHTEAVLSDETFTIRQVSECSGAECQ